MDKPKDLSSYNSLKEYLEANSKGDDIQGN